MKKCSGLRVKTFSYLKDNDEDKKGKATKKCVMTRKLNIEEYKKCLESA